MIVLLFLINLLLITLVEIVIIALAHEIHWARNKSRHEKLLNEAKKNFDDFQKKGNEYLGSEHFDDEWKKRMYERVERIKIYPISIRERISNWMIVLNRFYLANIILSIIVTIFQF